MNEPRSETSRPLSIPNGDAEEIRALLNAEIEKHPPTIGLIGVSGVGKSSTLNSLFRTKLRTSPTVACTKEFLATDLSLAVTRGEAKGTPVSLRVVDAPGLGEDVALDPEYLEAYRQQLPSCDVILWVLSARNRAISLEQTYLRELKDFIPKIVFGLNQVDLVDPLNWDTKINLPSKDQKTNIEIILKDRRAKLEITACTGLKMIPYSATTRYNLQELFTTLIQSCPQHRAWIFAVLKNFRYDDFLPAAALREIRRRKKGLFFYIVNNIVAFFRTLFGANPC
jgi:uncharacterized protein